MKPFLLRWLDMVAGVLDSLTLEPHFSDKMAGQPDPTGSEEVIEDPQCSAVLSKMVINLKGGEFKVFFPQLCPLLLRFPLSKVSMYFGCFSSVVGKTHSNVFFLQKTGMEKIS